MGGCKREWTCVCVCVDPCLLSAAVVSQSVHSSPTMKKVQPLVRKFYTWKLYTHDNMRSWRCNRTQIMHRNNPLRTFSVPFPCEEDTHRAFFASACVCGKSRHFEIMRRDESMGKKHDMKMRTHPTPTEEKCQQNSRKKNPKIPERQ